MSVPKRRGGRDWCGLYFENKKRSSVLSLCLVLVCRWTSTYQCRTDIPQSIECHRRKSEIAFRGIVECRPVVLCRVRTESVHGQNIKVHRT